MNTKQIRKYCELDDASMQLLKTAMERLNLSARAYDRILKVARTIADLEKSDDIETSHLAMHVWDEVDPALLQLDVYTCGPLDPQLVFSAMQVWKPVKIEWKFLDREHNLKQLDANPFPSPGGSIH